MATSFQYKLTTAAMHILKVSEQEVHPCGEFDRYTAWEFFGTGFHQYYSRHGAQVKKHSKVSNTICRLLATIFNASSIAQLVERPLSEREVVGSNPAAAPYQRCKNGTSSSLADARIKGAVLGR